MTDELLRTLAPQVLGVLVRRGDDFAAAEDAVQEALVEAHQRWPDNPPADPKAWLVTVAGRKLIDAHRSAAARRRREEAVALERDPGPTEHADDTLLLMFLCCHPALSAASAVALTLRAVGGLSTREIADAYLVPEATMAQRISRAKRTVSGERFSRPADIAVVLRVLYLIFNEGYGGEVHAAAEASPLVPLHEQDRSRWDSSRIAEGVGVLQRALAVGRRGEYQVQAAIAALHDDAPTPAETDWPQILDWYDELLDLTDNPLAALSRAVAVAEVHGPVAGLDALATLDQRLPGHHRLDAVRAHLLERNGERVAAREHYLRAADRTTSTAEREHLLKQAARLRPGP